MEQGLCQTRSHCVQCIHSQGAGSCTEELVGHRRNDAGCVCQAVLLEEDVVQLSDLRAEVSAEGHQGGNIIREYDDGMRLHLHRPLRDQLQALPNISVGILKAPMLCAVCLPMSKAVLATSE